LNDWGALYGGERKEIELAAGDLSVFQTLGFARDETRHSRILSWLLDPRGTHYQRAGLFGVLLGMLNLPQRWGHLNYHVETERSGDESRIDIRLYSEGEFLVDIEVKVDSAEGHDQKLFSEAVWPTNLVSI
jgi:hypothetical protein